MLLAIPVEYFLKYQFDKNTYIITFTYFFVCIKKFTIVSKGFQSRPQKPKIVPKSKNLMKTIFRDIIVHNAFEKWKYQ